MHLNLLPRILIRAIFLLVVNLLCKCLWNVCYLPIFSIKMMSVSVFSDKTGNRKWKVNWQLLRHISTGEMRDLRDLFMSRNLSLDIQLRAAVLRAPSSPNSVNLTFLLIEPSPPIVWCYVWSSAERMHKTPRSKSLWVKINFSLALVSIYSITTY